MKYYLLFFVILLASTGLMAQTLTISDLEAEGENIQWYAASTGGSPLATSTSLVDGQIYYASQTVNGVESTARLAVTAMVTATPAAPTADTHVATQAQIEWKWAAVTGATGYKWSATNNYGAASDLGNVLTNTEIGLSCGNSYTRYIWAYNTTDCGSAGTSMNASTSACVTPGAPTIGTAVAGDTQASVPFTAPASDGGSTITSYTATSSPSGFTGTLSQAGSGIIIVTGLTNGAPYTFTVIATNSVGTSIASAASNSVIPAIQNVTNPGTGKIWMDRNLGATQVANSSTDAPAYGDLYQWGRGLDGHQHRNSGTTSTLSSIDVPGHGNFILFLASIGSFDWRSPQNDNLWQGVSGTNNPCPTGYRIPTEAEFDAERQTWSTNNAAGALASPLKFTVAGYRNKYNGSVNVVGSSGYYWSSTVVGTRSRSLDIASSNALIESFPRANGFSVRCIKDPNVSDAPTIGTVVAGDAQASVPFTAPASDGGSTITTYTATSNPGNITGTLTQAGNGTITVTGLTNGIVYTFTVTATNIVGTSLASAASNSVLTKVFGSTDVLSNTGKIWKDRNLGASQVATSSTDAAAYGDLYQWGRGADGHQIRTSATTTTLSSIDNPSHGDFILSSDDWRSPKNDNLWQGVSGTNNPCPTGYRIPTEAELDDERQTWSTNNAAGAFASPLKFTLAGGRSNVDGALSMVGWRGSYWSSTITTYTRRLYFLSSDAYIGNGHRAIGYSVRCIKDE